MPIKTPQPGDGERRSAIGGRIRATRIQAGIGLRQMARDLGMSASWLLGVELGQHSIDAVRLDDVSRYLGVPASYFLDDSAFVRERQRQLMSRPATRLDWQLMYDGEDERARAHFELDRVFQRLEEARGSRVERPAGSD